VDNPTTPRKFSNHRDWRGFVSAAGCSVAYPNAMHALRAHGAWFVNAAAQTQAWLGAEARLT
jgi:hypothetical protein